jgi:hypothetical protein
MRFAPHPSGFFHAPRADQAAGGAVQLLGVLPERNFQGARIDRLEEVVVDPGHAGPPLGVREPGYHDQERPAPQRPTHPLGHGVPVGVRQADVQDHHVGGGLRRQPDRLLPVVGDAGAVAVQLDQHRQGVGPVRVVFHDEDGECARARHTGTRVEGPPVRLPRSTVAGIVPC